jgi:ParB-like chromosome segregation protein Spo0J
MAKKKPEAAAVWCPVEDLTPWADNPRLNDEAVGKVRDSIKRFGFASPIVARREDGMVIAGHTRLRAAIELGLDTVPVRWMDLDPADARLLALADNKLGEVAEWDDPALARLLQEMAASGQDLDLIGYDDDDLSALLASMEQPGDDEWGDAFDGLPDEDRAPFRQMTFTVHDDQHAEIERALKAAKDLGPFDSENENGNGNALARMAETFLSGRA